MPGIFVGSTELTDVGDIKIGSTDVQEIYVGATKVFPTAAPPTDAFDVDFEAGDSLPASFIFTRPSAAWFRNDSGVWVEVGTGVARVAHNGTPGGGGKGYFPEVEAEKLALHNRDFTDAVWSATNITPVKDATGIDGVANAASTLTATAGNGTIFQSFTRVSSAHTFTCFVSRKTGTGTVEQTIDGGTTWVDITSSLTSSLDNPFLVTQTLANPSIGFRIVTSGDEIEVDFADLEATAYGTSPMEVTGTAVIRSKDSLFAGISTSEPYSLEMDLTTSADNGDSHQAQMFQLGPLPDDTIRLTSQYQAVAVGPPSISINLVKQAASLRYKIGARLATDDIRLTQAPSASNDANAAVPIGDIGIGGNAADRQFGGVIHRAAAINTALTNQELFDYVTS